MENLRHQSLAQIVRKNINTVPVFEEYGFDFCCHGSNKLEDVCNENNVNVDDIIEKLDHVRSGHSVIQIDFNKLEVDELCEYIVNKHHAYVRQSIPSIQTHLQKITIKHGKNHPELNQVSQFFIKLIRELEPHMRKEEFILFPYITNLCQSTRGDAKKITPTSLIQNPIHLLEKEHEGAAEYLNDIKALTNDFTPPDDACMTYKLVYTELHAFEKDLHIHVHLENNILFPKAIEMERKLIQNDQNQTG